MKKINLYNLYLNLLIFIIIISPFFNGRQNIYIILIINILTGLATLFFIFKKNRPVAENNNHQNNFCFLFLFLFLIFSLITSFFSTSIFISLPIWFSYLAFGLLFYLITQAKFSLKYLDFLVNYFIVISDILCLVGIYFFIVGNYSRVTSLFYWPNPFASYLLFSIFIILYYLINNKKIFNSIILTYFSFILIITSFLFTFSRGALIGLIFALAIYLIINSKSILKHIKLLVVLILLIIICFYSINNSKKSSFPIISGKDGHVILDQSSKIRINYWRGAIKIYKDYPIFGSGLGTFQAIYPQYQKDPVSAGKYPHNLYLETLSETGIFTFSFFILFLISIYLIDLRKINKEDLSLPLYLGGMAFLIHNFFDIGWHYPANFYLFCLFIGLFYNLNKDKEIFILYNIQRFKSINFNKYKYLLILLSLILIFLGVINLVGEFNYQKGKNLEAENRFIEAEGYYQKSVKFYPNPNYLRRLGIIQYTLGLNDAKYLKKSYNSVEKLIKIEKNNSLNYELRGKIYLAENKLVEAENDFKESIKLDKYNYPRYYKNYAEALISENKFIEAKHILEEILSFYTDEVIHNRSIIIMPNQEQTSGIKKEINDIKKLLSKINYYYE